jgi:hypothetical protein
MAFIEDRSIPAGDFVPAAFAPFRRACFRFCLEDMDVTSALRIAGRMDG